jgi:hypothetical protein
MILDRELQESDRLGEALDRRLQQPKAERQVDQFADRE